MHPTFLSSLYGISQVYNSSRKEFLPQQSKIRFHRLRLVLDLAQSPALRFWKKGEGGVGEGKRIMLKASRKINEHKSRNSSPSPLLTSTAGSLATIRNPFIHPRNILNQSPKRITKPFAVPPIVFNIITVDI